MRLSNTTERDYANYIKRWQDSGLEPVVFLETLTRDCARVARAALRRAGVEGELPVYRQRKRVPRALAEQEYEQLRVGAYARNRRTGMAVEFIYFTGLRLREFCQARPTDTNQGSLVVRGKGDKERTVPLSPKALALLEVLPVGVGPWQIEKDVREAGAAVGVVVTPHRIRATFATTLLAKGVDVRVVQELMGHSDLTTTMGYLAVTDERLRKAVATL